MKMRIEFHSTGVSDVFDLSRVPCVGEFVTDTDGEEGYKVMCVCHVLDADPETQIAAIVRVN